jgi:hypothetical protein
MELEDESDDEADADNTVSAQSLMQRLGDAKSDSD